ncbi:DUF6160 family protein [Aquabacterium sp.]|uniref:DUF6160 family protein n=1 Tax=Aquabacterium sp. TaxID=1872578 RepID=UPI0035B35B6A
MSFFKRSILAAALLGAALSTPAMTALPDEQLAAVQGQDGVSIAGNLNLQIGSFRYADTDATGGSISFDKIGVTGMFVATVDIQNSTDFTSSIVTSMRKYGLSDSAIGVSLFKLLQAGVYDGKSDVVQIAIPNAGLDARLTPSITVAAVRMGGQGTTSAGGSGHLDDVGPSFGAFALNNINAQGTTLWMWAH